MCTMRALANANARSIAVKAKKAAAKAPPPRLDDDDGEQAIIRVTIQSAANRSKKCLGNLPVSGQGY